MFVSAASSSTSVPDMLANTLHKYNMYPVRNMKLKFDNQVFKCGNSASNV